MTKRATKPNVARSNPVPRSQHDSFGDIDDYVNRGTRSLPSTVVPRMVRNGYAAKVRFVPWRDLVTGGTTPGDTVVLVWSTPWFQQRPRRLAPLGRRTPAGAAGIDNRSGSGDAWAHHG